eukprot:364050-Chlamydomonas_euryale.AAC.14
MLFLRTDACVRHCGSHHPDALAHPRHRPMAPKGDLFDRAVDAWRQLASDPDAKYDKEVTLRGEDIAPTVTWGTSPQVWGRRAR